MAKGHWQPPEVLNVNPPTTTAPHMGTTKRNDGTGGGANTNLKGMVGRSGGEGKAEVRGDGWSNKRGNLPRTT